jgi:signal transduction histidine kinase
MHDGDALPASARTPGRLGWLLVTFRDELLDRWTQRALEDPAVPDANRLSKPALVDHVPEILERLLKRLAQHPPQRSGEANGRELGGSGVGVAHARQRIAVHYTLSEALRELSLLRVTVLALCEEHAVSLSLGEAELLHATLDEMMTASASELERISRRMSEQLMAVVAHDLRNPLNSIALQAALLRQGNFDLQKAEKAGNTLSRNAELMERLIGDLLTFSSLQAGHLAIEATKIDVRELMRHAYEMFKSLGEQRGIAVTATLPEKDVFLWCDGDRIAQALGNIIANALRFTAHGGRVAIELVAEGSQCIFRVRDTGPGIRPENIEDVFRPFWQADVNKQGLGLGLAIARGIIEAHGGEIGIEQLGAPGAAFVFAIPFDAHPKTSASVVPAAAGVP